MKLFPKKDDYNTFVQLILVACEDSQIKSEVITLTRLPWNARIPIINNLVETMEKKKAPKDFIDAIKILKKGDIAIQVYNLLTE
jgi:hypothetical protein